VSENAGEMDSDRTTGTEPIPIPDSDGEPPGETVRNISLNRRQSRTIAPPRKWRMIGLSQRICPECRAVVPSIQDGFWHLQTTHNQGKGVDLPAWGAELRDELDEFIAASQGRRGYVEDKRGRGVESLATAILIVMGAMAALFALYVVVTLHLY
jgi:hypothetical protein